jgi:hypothetical protein
LDPHYTAMQSKVIDFLPVRLILQRRVWNY